MSSATLFPANSHTSGFNSTGELNKGISLKLGNPVPLFNLNADPNSSRFYPNNSLQMNYQEPCSLVYQLPTDSFPTISPVAPVAPINQPISISLSDFLSNTPVIQSASFPTDQSFNSSTSQLDSQLNPIVLTNRYNDNRTKLVRIRRKGGQEVVSCDEYIGRAQNQGGWRLKQSEFANPFSLRKYSRRESLEKYRQFILARHDLMNKLVNLKGKVLGCWCCDCCDLPSDPSQYECHGQVLMELIEQYCK